MLPHVEPTRRVAKGAEKFEVHPDQISALKALLVERRCEVFGSKAAGNLPNGTERIEAKVSGYPWKMI